MIADTPNARITYRGEMPPEIHSALEPLLDKYTILIPDWCHRINGVYDSAGKDTAAASSTCYYEYRWAKMAFYPSFFDSNKDQREEYLVHEMVHVSVNPLYDYTRAAIERLFELGALKDEDGSKGFKALKDLIIMELKDRNECVTTDLQKIITQLMVDREKGLSQ